MLSLKMLSASFSFASFRATVVSPATPARTMRPSVSRMARSLGLASSARAISAAASFRLPKASSIIAARCCITASVASAKRPHSRTRRTHREVIKHQRPHEHADRGHDHRRRDRRARQTPRHDRYEQQRETDDREPGIHCSSLAMHHYRQSASPRRHPFGRTRQKRFAASVDLGVTAAQIIPSG